MGRASIRDPIRLARLQEVPGRTVCRTSDDPELPPLVDDVATLPARVSAIETNLACRFDGVLI
jgi:hypothetical protein